MGRYIKFEGFMFIVEIYIDSISSACGGGGWRCIILLF